VAPANNKMNLIIGINMHKQTANNADQVKLESITILFKNNQTSLIAACIVAISLLLSTRAHISTTSAIIWLSLLIGAYSLRSLIGYLFNKYPIKTQHYKIWLNAFRIATACCGAAWGLSVYFISLNNNLELQAVMILVLAGVCCGGLINLSIDTISAAAFSICLWLFASPVMLTQTKASSFVFMLLALYIFYVGLASRQLSGGLIASIKSKLNAEYKEKEITELTRRQSLHLLHTPMGVIEWDENLNVIAWNRACIDIFGHTDAEALGKHISYFIPELASLDTEHITGRLKLENNQLKQLHNKNIEVIYCELSNTILRNQEGKFIGMASMVQDKTDFIASQNQIKQLAYYDTLTNLPNRGLLLDRIKQALIVNKRNKTYGMVAFIDLDHFKAINDIKGHNAGDELLKAIANRLVSNIREQDTAARLGGDEFVIVLSGIGNTEAEAQKYGKQVIEKIAIAINLPVEFEDYLHKCSASIGICLFNDDNLDATELLRRADVSMYLSKKQGRNTYQFYDAALQPKYEYELKLKHDLNHAIESKQLQLHLQGQYDRDSNLTGAEVLLRWQHPEFGMVMPNTFIPLAEENGTIVPIGDWVLNQACNLLKKWQNDKFSSNLSISVNVSAIQFNHSDFILHIKQAIEKSGCDARKLCIELTESSVINNIDESIKKMHQIKAMGVSLAIDDFGTGYSSLSALKNLPLNELKIDKSFVKDFTKNSVDLTIVQTILQMGKNLNLRIVAEGVETESQMAYLSNYGCAIFQGYYFAQPSSVADFEESLRQSSIKSTPNKKVTKTKSLDNLKSLVNTDLLVKDKPNQAKQPDMRNTLAIF
jgi:diguanylate cyclase (GGDEF)-like protein/PAS domain S-box-containing protein